MSFSIIAAIGKNNELGKNGGLCFQLHEDMKYFREKTKGHAILMGSKTFLSLPKLLPGRKHIVVSSRMKDSDFPEGVIHFETISEALKEFSPSDDSEEIFVIGGGMVYAEMIPYCSKLYLTEVDAEDSDADTFFQPFDKSLFSREVVGSSEEDGVKFEFVVYMRKEEL